MEQRDYHHGDLPSALRASAVELIAERGPAKFSLREVARRSGVSHTAPAHHFGDAEGLLTSVATEGFELLSKEMAIAYDSADDARGKLIACGRAYLRTALDNPGHYGVMIGHDYTDEDNPDFLVACLGAHNVLYEVIGLLRDTYNPDLDVDATAALCWSTVHGIVELAPISGHVAETMGTTESTTDELIVTFADLVINGIRAR